METKVQENDSNQIERYKYTLKIGGVERIVKTEKPLILSVLNLFTIFFTSKAHTNINYASYGDADRWYPFRLTYEDGLLSFTDPEGSGYSHSYFSQHTTIEHLTTGLASSEVMLLDRYFDWRSRSLSYSVVGLMMSPLRTVLRKVQSQYNEMTEYNNALGNIHPVQISSFLNLKISLKASLMNEPVLLKCFGDKLKSLVMKWENNTRQKSKMLLGSLRIRAKVMDLIRDVVRLLEENSKDAFGKLEELFLVTISEQDMDRLLNIITSIYKKKNQSKSGDRLSKAFIEINGDGFMKDRVNILRSTTNPQLRMPCWRMQNFNPQTLLELVLHERANNSRHFEPFRLKNSLNRMSGTLTDKQNTLTLKGFSFHYNSNQSYKYEVERHMDRTSFELSSAQLGYSLSSLVHVNRQKNELIMFGTSQKKGDGFKKVIVRLKISEELFARKEIQAETLISLETTIHPCVGYYDEKIYVLSFQDFKPMFRVYKSSGANELISTLFPLLRSESGEPPIEISDYFINKRIRGYNGESVSMIVNYKCALINLEYLNEKNDITYFVLNINFRDEKDPFYNYRLHPFISEKKGKNLSESKIPVCMNEKKAKLNGKSAPVPYLFRYKHKLCSIIFSEAFLSYSMMISDGTYIQHASSYNDDTRMYKTMHRRISREGVVDYSISMDRCMNRVYLWILYDSTYDVCVDTYVVECVEYYIVLYILYILAT